LSQQLLTFAKGGGPVKRTISISELLMDSANLALSGAKTTSKFDIPYDLRQVEADKGQLDQVFSNLFINANHAMPEGGTINVMAENINIEAGDSLLLNEGRYVKIIVADQGIGIHQDHLQKVFDPYFTTKTKGSGLGLAITHSIVKKHDGHICVDSEMGVGTTFHIYLPACEVEITGDTVPGETEREGVGTTSLAGKKVLFMDDDAIISMSVTRELKDLEYEVEYARNGTEAIKLYKESIDSRNPFDAVILDLTIPGGMGGMETIRKLLTIDPDVKAIVASGYSNDPVMSNFKEYGFKDAVAKPYGIEELDEALRGVILGD